MKPCFRASHATAAISVFPTSPRSCIARATGPRSGRTGVPAMRGNRAPRDDCFRDLDGLGADDSYGDEGAAGGGGGARSLCHDCDRVLARRSRRPLAVRSGRHAEMTAPGVLERRGLAVAALLHSSAGGLGADDRFARGDAGARLASAAATQRRFVFAGRELARDVRMTRCRECCGFGAWAGSSRGLTMPAGRSPEQWRNALSA